jgi:hypothetical protein
LFAKFDSHPFATSPSQFPKPLVQVAVQAPLAQAGVPLVTVGQRIAHAPQFATSVIRLRSHPLDVVVSQSPKPVLHAMAHAAALQTGVLFAPLVHVRPHSPQLSASTVVSVQVVPQRVVPVAHPSVHVYVAGPPSFAIMLHVAAVGGHTRVQLPHAAALVMSVSQPSSGFVLQ